MTRELRLTDLRYAYPGFDFGPVSLGWSPGRVYGLLGPNGAGKTTLLNLVAQQLRPASGRIAHGDYEPVRDDPAWKARLSYVRERPSFYEEFRVREMLHFAARLYDRWDAALADRLLERLQLDPAKKIRALSKGNYVKLGLVAGLAARVEVLLLDEPTAGLDPSARAEIQQIIEDLTAERREALCVVLSSHIFEDLEVAADDVLVMKAGRVAFQVTKEELASLALFRFDGEVGEEVIAAARLAWRTTDARWLLVSRSDDLARTMAARPDCVEERPRSLMEAVYHGVQRSR